jgi:hypothetical protein
MLREPSEAPPGAVGAVLSFRYIMLAADYDVARHG